jgi:hypothetical protein
MAIAQVGSAQPKYFAATDILIGDMSNTAYEFLLFNRPIILLANAWLRKNYANVGIKTDLVGLEAAIKRSLENPGEFREPRESWLKKTIFMPDGRSSARCIDLILEKANIPKPRFVFIHGGDPVRKTNLSPMVKEVEKRGLEYKYVVSHRKSRGQDDTIYVAAHVVDLNITGGYKVHFNHDPRGEGSTNLDWEKKFYGKYDYFPLIDLHITAGEVGDYRTKLVLGPMAARTAIGGYPKADDFLRINTEENKKSVYKELGLEPGKPLITYAPAAKVSDLKPGGSLSDEAVATLKDIATRNDLNLLFKFKYPRGIILLHAVHRLRRMLAI